MKFSPDLEQWRVIVPPHSSPKGAMYGLFYIPLRSHLLKVIACDGDDPSEGWEHVSVSLPNRCPNWEELCFIKRLFWSDEETVVQFHPRKSAYVNIHPYCLHLWRKAGTEYELPPSHFI